LTIVSLFRNSFVNLLKDYIPASAANGGRDPHLPAVPLIEAMQRDWKLFSIQCSPERLGRFLPAAFKGSAESHGRDFSIPVVPFHRNAMSTAFDHWREFWFIDPDDRSDKPGEWWIRYADVTGRIRREKAGTWVAARDLYSKRKTEVLQGRKLPEKLRRARVSFGEIAKDALEHSKAHKVHEAYRIDSWHMETLLAWFRERVAEEITPQEIERKLNELAEDGRKPATVNRYRTLVSLVFSLAVRNGKQSSNPVRLVKRRKENNERVRFLEPEEEVKLRGKICELCPEHEAEFDLALHTGMRRGEQYRLRWQDVDLKRNFATIARSKHGEARRIQINSIARGALLRLRERGHNVGYVCPGHEGPRARDWRHWFEDAVEQAQIYNFRWHDLRHTFASRLVMAGVPLRAVQLLMGHKCIETTLRYSHLGETELHNAVERLTATSTDTTTSTAQSGASNTQAAASA
jgi:integrase